MVNKTVFIANGAFFGSVVRMFTQRGWTVVDPDKAEFLCLTGGEDIDPALYGETPLKGTYYSPSHDLQEIELINRFHGKPKLGICRGAQLLNVVAGKGSMYQDVNNHHREHVAFDTRYSFSFRVSSIHHQMMIPGPEARILAVSAVSTEKLSFGKIINSKNNEPIGNDPECIWYPDSKSLCYQPHPEVGPSTCTDYFFDTIDELFFEEA